MSIRIGLTLIACICFAGPGLAADWAQFRGPGGLGESSGGSIPTTWTNIRNIAWKAELPGPGASSPIIVGDHVFLTCYSGYGLKTGGPSEMSELKRHVICLERGTGEFVWKKAFDPKLDESSYSGSANNMRHGYASSTIASDGKRLYVFFGKSGVYCLSMSGDQLWHAEVGAGLNKWGSATSPLLYKGLVIINASVESRSLVALDAQSGDLVWRVGGLRSSWNTPALVEAPDGGTELVVSVQSWLLGFDPATGDELWRCKGVPSYACPSVIHHDGVIYVTGGRGTQYTFAVRAGGRGDVSATHEVWRVSKGSNVSSPVYHDGHLYLASDSNSIAYCFDARDGGVVYQQRMRPTAGRIYSSPLLANGNVYFASQQNGTFVVAAKPRFQLVAHNALDDLRTNASPVPHDGQLLIRNDGFLYCIGKR